MPFWKNNGSFSIITNNIYIINLDYILVNYEVLLTIITYILTVAPTNNPECQSFADLINEIKKRFDQIPISLLPIPGLDPTKPTTLQCYEHPNCTGFNCSGQIYGTDIQFSFKLDYCAKPATAQVSVSTSIYEYIYLLIYLHIVSKRSSLPTAHYHILISLISRFTTEIW